MAVFAIPNPKKTIQIDFPIEKVKLCIKNLSLINNKYKFQNSNEILNQYTFESYEFLSLGVYLDFHLNSINENKTEINVEIRRKVGTFNHAHEINNAADHFVKIFDAISKLLVMPLDEIEKLDNARVENLQSNAKASKPWFDKTGLIILLLILLWPLGLLGVWKNTKFSKGLKIGISMIYVIILYLYYFKK